MVNLIKNQSIEQEANDLVDELNKIIDFLDLTQQGALELIEKHYFKIYGYEPEKELSISSFRKILQGRKTPINKLKLYINCLKESKEYHQAAKMTYSREGDNRLLGDDIHSILLNWSEQIRKSLEEDNDI
ncbi:hypothetical protein [Haemophilus haemolyticus]|uniref:hypothetical protein n=1 Tax=Haemophilus haemolyticus TaxID=726 RepID=UPI00112C4E8B|nr:hypothetical protein [Haemophilus haemolyticus]TPH07563.1 hypothetical protein EUX49_09165 [Haemophilus haemolyticus]